MTQALVDGGNGAHEPGATAKHAVPQGKSAPALLHHLDGLRGLAALYVLLGHIFIALLYFDTTVVLPSVLRKGLSVLVVGQTAVDVFIVLSGYCLMLPVVRKGYIEGGFSSYVRRRARRILPPYYGALALGLGIAWIINVLHGVPSAQIVTWPDLVAHLFLVHNVKEAWIHSINPPMWSVAVEWQIYFFFPLLLLPVEKRLGPFFVLITAFGIGLAPHFLLDGFLDWSFPWFLGEFALGMIAACVSFSPRGIYRIARERVPWGVAAAVIGGAIFSYCALSKGWYGGHKWLADPIIALATACFLVWAGIKATAEGERPSRIVTFLSSPAAMWLGSFSYSIYLVHYPVMTLFWNLTHPIAMSGGARAALMYGVGAPIMLGAAYLFYLAFERPFMKSARHVTPKVSGSASLASP